jgi:phage/plasmid-associated DNA primase
MVLIAAKRLLTRRRFVKSPSVEDVRGRYQALADPVKAWIGERCVLGPKGNGNKKLLHSDFDDYCVKRKIKKRLELNALGRELAKYGIEDKQIGSEREHVWSAIALKDGEATEE